MADISHIRIGQLVRDIKDAAARLLIANLQLALNSLTSRVETAEGKLAGIQSGAQVNVLETVKVNGTALSVTDKAVDVTVPSYSDATTSASGLMSAADKSKLNGIATGATKVIVDSALDGTSTNPVENQAVHSALAGKAAASHTHDDRYYTEGETDTLLNGKSNTGHTHDDRYYTESETDTLLNGKSDTGHTHDDRYYTEAETDSLLNGKSDTGHTHDDRYYTESEVDTALSGKSNTGHDHDDRYYTETEMDTALGEKVAKSGDTMTGTLIQKTTLDITTHPASDATISGLQFQDANGVVMGNLNIRQNADGASGVYLHTRRSINGTVKSHSLLLLIADDGTRTVELSDAEPWQDALDITKLLTTSNADGTYTSNSYIGTTFTFKCYRRGLMCTILVDFNKSSTATGSDFVKIGTIPSGYRPNTSYYNQPGIQAQNAHVTIRVTNGGNLDLYGNHTTTGRVRCTFTYPIAASEL